MKKRKTEPKAKEITPAPLDFNAIENAVAISDGFHNDPKAYKQFYDWHGEDLGGFPGIWKYVAEASLIFTAAETPGCWDNGEWIETIGKYADYILKADKVPTPEDLKKKMKELMAEVARLTRWK